MSFSAKELIKKRRSVRTFDGRDLSKEDKSKLENYVNSLENPFGVNVDFRLLDAKENDLSSPVIVGANSYIAAKVKRTGQWELAYGYSFEKMCIYALSLGIGTVMLAASLSRKAFEKAMDVQADEVMPTASPVGYPAGKMSVRENLMRKGLKADDRIAFDKLYFNGSFETTLTEDAAGVFAEALELARWAPSATNKQPWRAVVDGDKVHFYEYRSMKENALGDIQKVDIGIAICHFDSVIKENGIKGNYIACDPEIETPENTFYITTFEITDHQC